MHQNKSDKCAVLSQEVYCPTPAHPDKFPSQIFKSDMMCLFHRIHKFARFVCPIEQLFTQNLHVAGHYQNMLSKQYLFMQNKMPSCYDARSQIQFSKLGLVRRACMKIFSLS